MSDDMKSFYSSAAQRGHAGYWEFPAMDITWAFESGLPDPDTFPIADLLRLHEQTVKAEPADALQYGSPLNGSIVYGYEGLRSELLARTQAEDGRTDLDLKSIMLTSGGIQALTLACDAFIDPGDVMAVEAPTWNAVLGAAQQRGAEAIAVPLDENGMLLDVLEDQLKKLQSEGRRLKLLYTIASFNTPTGISLSADRRKRLVELAQKYNFLVLEDNVYGALRYEGEAIPSILSLDDSGLVFRVDSFSKTLAPALRIGWVTGHPDVIGGLSAVKGDLGISQWTARVLAEYLREGLYDPHLEKVKALYHTKRDIAMSALDAHCSPHVTFSKPDGGFFLWVELADNIDGTQVMMKGIADGVVCRPGERFFGETDQGKQFFRLAFTQVPTDEIERGIAVLGKAIAASTKEQS